MMALLNYTKISTVAIVVIETVANQLPIMTVHFLLQPAKKLRFFSNFSPGEHRFGAIPKTASYF